MQKVRPTMCFIAHCNDVFLLFNQVYQLILDHQDHLDVMVKTTAAGQEQTPSLISFSM